MKKEYIGKTEEEAIQNAIEDLHIEKDDFDVEVIESGKKGLFKRPFVKIRVTVGEDIKAPPVVKYFTKEDEEVENLGKEEREPKNDLEIKILEFTNALLKKMGFDEERIEIESRSSSRLTLLLKSNNSGLLIGYHGATLEALQVIVNSCFILKDNSDYGKIVIDIEGYRSRREELIIRNALIVAKRVNRNKSSELLEPMNSYERRLVHQAINDIDGVFTESEGEGAIKRVRIIPE